MVVDLLVTVYLRLRLLYVWLHYRTFVARLLVIDVPCSWITLPGYYPVFRLSPFDCCAGGLLVAVGRSHTFTLVGYVLPVVRTVVTPIFPRVPSRTIYHLPDAGCSSSLYVYGFGLLILPADPVWLLLPFTPGFRSFTLVYVRYDGYGCVYRFMVVTQRCSWICV